VNIEFKQLPYTGLNADAVLAIKGSSFYWARFFLGKRHAQRATRLYRFCRYIDDIADEVLCNETAEAQLALNAISQDISRKESQNPITQDMLLLMQECDIAPGIILSLLEGVTQDLTPVMMQDTDALIRYCYLVAGTVGVMMCKILDIKDPRAYPFAIDLGIAMQLTNISRDVAADAKLGRCYLPLNTINTITSADLTLDDLVMPPDEKKVDLQACLNKLLILADSYYESSRYGLHFIDVKSRLSILVAANVYRQIGVLLKARQYQYWLGRVRVSKPTKMLVTVNVFLKALITPHFWHFTYPYNQHKHDATLHNALIDLPYANTPANTIAQEAS
jgi:15-cis-phytoene synthase